MDGSTEEEKEAEEYREGITVPPALALSFWPALHPCHASLSCEQQIAQRSPAREQPVYRKTTGAIKRACDNERERQHTHLVQALDLGL